MTTIHNTAAQAFSPRDTFFFETMAAAPVERSFDEHLQRAQDAAAAPPATESALPPQNTSSAAAAAPPKRSEGEESPEERAAEESNEGIADGPTPAEKPAEAKADVAADEVEDEKPAEASGEADEAAKGEAAEAREVAVALVAAVVPAAVQEVKVDKAKSETAETPAPKAIQPAASADDEVPLVEPPTASLDTTGSAPATAEVTTTAGEPKPDPAAKKAERAPARAETAVAPQAKEVKAAVPAAETLAAAVPVISPPAAANDQHETAKGGTGEEKGRTHRSAPATVAAVVEELPSPEAAAAAPAATVVSPAAPAWVAAMPEMTAQASQADESLPTGEVGPVEGARRPDAPAVANTKPAAAAQPSGHTEVDPARFVQRVANAFRAASDASSPLRLKLSPPELGSLRLEITVQHGAMTARVEAETVETRNLLLDNLPALRERLAQQDIKIANFQVDLADRRLGSGADQAAGQFQRHDPGHPPPGGPRPARTTTTTSAVAPTTARRVNDDSQLNVIV